MEVTFNKDKGIVTFKGVRLGFRNLWHLRSEGFDGKPDTSYAGALIFSEEEKAEFQSVVKFLLGQVKEVIPSLEVGNLFYKGSNTNGQLRYPRFRKTQDEETGVTEYLIKTSNSEKKKTMFFDGQNKMIRDPQDHEHTIYPGCRVNAKVQFNPVSDNGKCTLWSNMVAIQFAGHDTPIGQHISEEEASEGFDVFDTAFDKAGEEKKSESKETDVDFDAIDF